MAASSSLATASSSSLNTASSAQSSSSTAALLQGVFIDGVVGGIHYQTETQQGVTNAQGAFNYRIGETITFSIGNLTLPPALAQATLTPKDLAPNDTTTQTNILQLLQTLDADGNHDNGIQLRADAAAAFANIVVDITQEAFDTEIAASLQALDQNLTLSDATKAQSNFDNSLQRQLLGSWLYSEGEGKRNLLTFIADGRYLILHEHDDPQEDTNPQTAGSVEFGRYQWNSQSGKLTITLTAQSDGTGGFSSSNPVALSATLKGHQLELTPELEEKVLFTRVARETNSLVGTWVNDAGNDAIEVVSILSDNQYAVIHTQNTGAYGNNTAQALAGEWGDYTLTTNGFQATAIQAEADGNAGFYNQTLANTQTVFGLEQNTWGEIAFTQADQTTSYARAETFAAHLQDDGTPLQTITVNRAAQGFSADEVINSNWAFAVAVAGISDCDPQTDQGCGITFELEFTSASSGKIKEASEALNEKLNFTWSLNNIGTLSLQFTDANNEDFVMTLAKLASNAEQARVLLSLKGSSGEVDLWESQVKDFVPALDSDNDGISDELDPDDDNDGVLDFADAFPFDATESIDTDMDGIGNNADTDDDNDMVADLDDAFPFDANESVDTDMDGMGNNADLDDDNDMIADIKDAFPLDASESVDTDMDGIGNNADTDDDNDGVADTFDAYPMDADFVRAAATPMALNGDLQFTLYGTLLREYCGQTVSAVGDVNHDNYPDFIIGCGTNQNPNNYNGPNAYLIFGPLTAGAMELSALDGSNGVVIHKSVDIPPGELSPQGYDAFGFGGLLTGGHDLNGDGIDDMVIADTQEGSSRAYVIFGQEGTWPALFDVTTIDGSNGSAISFNTSFRGADRTTPAMDALALSPDMNNDGIAELVLTTQGGATRGTVPYQNWIQWGEALVVFGQQQWPASITLSTSTLDGTNGFRIKGRETKTDGFITKAKGSDRFNKVATGGDFNGDGAIDLALIDPDVYDYDPDSTIFTLKGEAYVISVDSAVNGFIDLNDPNYTPLLALKGYGVASNILYAFTGDLKFVKNLNRDDIDDLMVGSPQQNEVYAVFGQTSAIGHLSVNDLNGSNGFTFDSKDLGGDPNLMGIGSSFVDLGDINDDGFSDIAFSDFIAGQFYFVTAGRQQWPSRFTFAKKQNSNGTAGRGFRPGYYSFTTIYNPLNIAAVGDMNSDGLPDLLVAVHQDTNPNRPTIEQPGSVTVIFSCSHDCAVLGSDADGDGTPDIADAFPSNPLEAIDSDNDGFGNNADEDDDDDGVIDSLDLFPYDFNEQSDSDMDGIGDNADTDGDNDGVDDALDAFPNDATEAFDTDMDGIGNNADLDDDNDGITDIDDAFPLDANESVDTDMDGIGNNADTDDDNDGVADTFDAYPFDADFVRAAITPMEFNSDAQFTLYGAQLQQNCGLAISPAGDVNHDGKPDFLVGCNYDNSPTTYDGPSAYLIFGPLTAGSLELSQLDGNNGVKLHKAMAMPSGTGIDANNFGHLLAGGDDLNGDGIDDIVIAELAGSPRAYVIFGQEGAWPAVLDVNTLDGNNGSILHFNAATADNYFGGVFTAIAISPDLNQDGIAELVLATTNQYLNNSFGWLYWGEALVLYGQTQWPATIALTDTLMDGTNGFKIMGRPTKTNGSAGKATGSNRFNQVATGGDVNGDGEPDIALLDSAVSDYDAVTNSFSRKGEAYVVDAKSAVDGVINLNDPDYSPLLTLQGNPTLGLETDVLSYGLQLLKDLNRDGTDELIVGSSTAREAYIVFGNQAANTTLNTTELDGSNGLTLQINSNGSGNHAANSFANLGDINGDSYNDFALSTYVGYQTYIVHGGRQQWPARLTLGVHNTPGYFSYQSVYGEWAYQVITAGDLNGDGINDLIVSSSNAGNPNQPELGQAGSATVIFSCTQDCPLFGIDTDNDGTPDLSDAFPQNPLEALDSDGDGIGNNADFDDDNDGVDDSEDAFPYNPDKQSDSDMDGIGDNAAAVMS